MGPTSRARGNTPERCRSGGVQGGRPWRRGEWALDYLADIERQTPDFYPGSAPWSDDFESLGSYPAADGLGSTIMRLRVRAAMLSSWLEEHWPRYRTWPSV